MTGGIPPMPDITAAEHIEKTPHRLPWDTGQEIASSDTRHFRQGGCGIVQVLEYLARQAKVETVGFKWQLVNVCALEGKRGMPYTCNANLFCTDVRSEILHAVQRVAQSGSEEREGEIPLARADLQDAAARRGSEFPAHCARNVPTSLRCRGFRDRYLSNAFPAMICRSRMCIKETSFKANYTLLLLRP